MSVVEFINDMPSFSEKNFSCFKPKNRQRRSKIIYISTKEGPPSQEIVTDNTNILIRYLNTKYKKEHEHNKRELEDGEKTTMGAKRTKMNTSDSSSKDTDEGSDTFYSFTSGSE